MQINPEIFGEYDVRGIFGHDFDLDFARKLGGSIAGFLGGAVVIGRDGRDSSSQIEKEVIKSILANSIDVYEIGECSSPLFYFAINYLNAAGGIMVTASHNQPEYNGFKIVGKKGKPIAGEKIKKIFESGMKGEETNLNIAGKIKDVRIETENEYKKKIATVVESDEDITNSGLTFEFDPDKDRVVFFEKGEKIPADFVFALLTERLGFKKVVCDLRFSRSVRERLSKLEVEIIRSKVGHPNFYENMKKSEANFGGETSGHFYFKLFDYLEAPELVVAYVAKITKESGKSLKQLTEGYQKYFKSEEINIDISPKAKIGEFFNLLKEKYSDGKINELDGITVEYPDWWFNIRQSRTEPVIRLIVEAKTKSLLEEKVVEMSKLISEGLPLPIKNS